MRAWLPLAAASGRIVVAFVLLFAAWEKLTGFLPIQGRELLGLDAFAHLIRTHAVLPASLAGVTARAVVGVEIIIAVLLLWHRWPRAAAGSAMVLLVLFSVYLGLLYASQDDPNCGCFGSLSDNSLASGLTRNALLIAACSLSLIPTKSGKRTQTPLKESAGESSEVSPAK